MYSLRKITFGILGLEGNSLANVYMPKIYSEIRIMEKL